ncbi:glycosyl hydrolase family 18 protein [Pedobacter sp.]|uniref:glycosyl hydrolase family 18 protein n=1 Tax=Pedobacter sp. TaxID=1411316 RepID=UPI00396C2E20
MYKRILTVVGALIFFVTSCKKSDPLPETDVPKSIEVTPTPFIEDNSFKIVAYMPSYRDPATIDPSKYKMITHLFYAFLEPADAADGSLKALSQSVRFGTVSANAKANKIKFGISVSGAKTVFENIAKSSTARTKFVTAIVDFAKRNNLDGVDMDWEYPSTSAGVESADNYTLLMRELSTELHKTGKFLSAAVTPAVYTGGIRDGIKPEVYPYIDFFNIMQYDGQTWDKDDPNQHASYKMSVYSTDIWLNTKGLPRSKAVLGMPLYGKNAAGSSKAYREFETAGLDITQDKVTLAGVDYWFNGINTIKLKTQLAKEQANGIMFWEFANDSNNANSLIKAANDQLGRKY